MNIQENLEITLAEGEKLQIEACQGCLQIRIGDFLSVDEKYADSLTVKVA